MELQWLRVFSLPIHPQNSLSTDALNTAIEHPFTTLLAAIYMPEFAFPLTPISQSADLHLYQVHIPPAPSFCRDHFPDHPLLPAYAILLFLRHCLHHSLGLQPAQWSWQQLKFLRPILPNAELTLELAPSPSAIQIKLREQSAVCFSGRFVADCPPRA